MTKGERKAARFASSKAISARFPKGGNDPLARSIAIGNSYRSVDRLDFKLVKTGTMKGK